MITFHKNGIIIKKNKKIKICNKYYNNRRFSRSFHVSYLKITIHAQYIEAMNYELIIIL